MLFEKINIQEKLQNRQLKISDQNQIISQVKALFENDTILREEIKLKIQSGSDINTNDFDFEQLESDRIFHVSAIKSICVDYRLRFLDSNLFKNTIPIFNLLSIKKFVKT